MSFGPADIGSVFAGLGQLVGGLSVPLGVWVAYSQLRHNREEKRYLRRVELAEEMYVISAQIDTAFKDIRNPFDSIPQDRIHDKEFVYRKRFERVSKYNDEFQKLRELQVRLDLVAGQTGLDAAVVELFAARNDVVVAIEMLIDLNDSDSPPDLESRRRHSQALYSVGGGNELTKKIENAVNKIQVTCIALSRKPSATEV